MKKIEYIEKNYYGKGYRKIIFCEPERLNETLNRLRKEKYKILQVGGTREIKFPS